MSIENGEHTAVLTDDSWQILDALDAVPGVEHTDWYKRLEKAADEATKIVAMNHGWITRQ